MKKLFFTRLALYLLATMIPVIHPAIGVSYDNVSRWAWQIILPAEMLFAFFLRPPLVAVWIGPAAGLGFLALAVAGVTGMERSYLLFIGTGFYGYLSTLAVFSGRMVSLATLETFFLAAVYYRVLSFARASEELAKTATRETTAVFVLAAGAFLIHSIVLYLSAYPDRSSRKKRKEFVFIMGVIVPLTLALAYFLPPDFVKHAIALNDLNEEPPPNPRPMGDGMDNGGGGRPQEHTRNGLPLGNRDEKYPSQSRSGKGEQQDQNQGGQGGQGDGTPQQGQGGSSGEMRGQQGSSSGKSGSGSSSGNQNKLEGVPADQWDNTDQNSGKGKGKQKAVMIVAGKIEPIYMGELYLEKFNGTRFSEVEKNSLNELGSRRLMETWEDSQATYDFKRKPFDIYYLSTLDHRVLAYRPVRIEPTVQDKRYHPFDLSYRAVSAMSISDPDDWGDVRELNDIEKYEYADALSLEGIDPAIRKRLKEYVSTIINKNDSYFKRFDSILRSFKGHQYEMGFDDRTDIDYLSKFLFETKTGDCTEFAHSVALLGRTAGFPVRVVYGYLASADLQTPAHRRGIYELRKMIPMLNEFPIEELFLITTSHHHAWVQLFIPGYGWVDFETTSFAKPPKPEMDPNNMDVLIPMIEEEDMPRDLSFRFPWRLALILFGALAVITVTALYSFRFGKELYLKILSRKNTKKGLDALYRLFFMKLAANGYPLKERSRTIAEFAKIHPELKDFGSVYTMLRYRQIYYGDEHNVAWDEIRKEYRDAIKSTQKTGFLGPVKRIISLRGLYY